MNLEVLAVNRACLRAAGKLGSAGEDKQRLLMREYGLNKKDVRYIQALDGESVRNKSQNPIVLFKLRGDRLRSAVASLGRGVDYYNVSIHVTNETSMAISLYAAALLKCLREDIGEGCLRFSISLDIAEELLKYGADEVIEAILANLVTFEPSRSFKAKFMACNNLERTRFMLQEMNSFLHSNNIIVSNM